jgi:autotransporter translocation and assembly factor TamB
VQGQYANRRGVLRQATVKGPDIDVQASGPIALDDAGQSNVKYHVAATNLATLGKLANQPDLSGSAVLDGTVTGNAAALKIAGTLDGSNLGYQANKALDLNSTYTVTVPELQFAKAEVQAQTTGSFIEAGGLQINTLTANTTYGNQTLTFQTHVAEAPGSGPRGGARELDASGSVLLHPDHSEIHLPSLVLRTQGVEWKTAPGSQAAIEYGAGRVTVNDLHLVNADQSLKVSGTFALGDNPQLGGVTVEAQNVDVAQLEKLAMQDRGFTGRLNANATLSGNATAPDVKGRVDIENGGFQQFKYQSLTATGTFASNRIGIDAKLVQSPGVELTAKGTVPMSALTAKAPAAGGHVPAAPADSIDVQVKSTKIDLGIVQGFTTQVTNVTGTVEADVHVSGTAADPHLSGFVDFQNGAFDVPEAKTRFTGMTTRIELQPDRIRVPRFQILDQHGHALTVQGELAVHERQGGAVNVSVDSDDFKLFDNELGDLHLETHLKLTGEVRKPRIEGELRTDAARLEVDKILLLFASPYSEEALPDVVSAQDTVTSAKGADEATRDALAKGREVQGAKAPAENAAAPEAAPKTGVFSAMELNVHLVAPDNVVVRGDDIRPGGASAMAIGSLNATVGADLTITKQVDGPVVIRGTANTVRGFYEFQGRRFTLLRDGTARFRGTPSINPDLDITAERLIPNTGVTARIHITGTPQAPKLTLSSNPAGLDEADILSLIVFNRNVNQLGSGEKASLAETAGGIASGFVASSLGKSIGKALDVDLFEITTSDPETGETAGGLNLGKQVSDRAFVQYRQQFGQRSFTQFMLEYQLAKFLRVDFQFAPETSGVANRLTQRRVERAGVDLIFFFSY